MSVSLQPHGLQHARLPCPSQSPGASPNPCPLSWWCHPAISSSVLLLSCLQSSPGSGSFPMSWLFTSCGRNSRASASASVLPMNVLGWFPLGLTGLISLKSKGLSSLLQHHDLKSSKSLALSFLYDPTCTSVHDYWKTHSIDYTDLCWQSDVSAF